MKALVFFLLAMISIPSFAAQPNRFGAGLLLGFSKVSDMSLGASIGIEGNMPLGASLSLSLGYERTSSSVVVESSGTTFDVSKSFSLIQPGIAYLFSPMMYAGLKTGIASLSSESTASSTSTITATEDESGLFVRPFFGYEIPLGNMTVGGELSYLFPFSSTLPGEFALLGVFKYWF